MLVEESDSSIESVGHATEPVLPLLSSSPRHSSHHYHLHRPAAVSAAAAKKAATPPPPVSSVVHSPSSSSSAAAASPLARAPRPLRRKQQSPPPPPPPLPTPRRRVQYNGLSGLLARAGGGAGRKPRPVGAADVAQRLKEFNERPGVEFLADDAWFRNPLVKIEGNARVVGLGYAILRLVCEEVSYTVLSSYATSEANYLVEADVTYRWRWPMRAAVKPLTFHLFDSVHIRDANDELMAGLPVADAREGAARDWECYEIEQVWDTSQSIVVHFVSSPFVKVAALALYVWDAALLFVALLFSFSF